MIRTRRARIVATLGPASNSAEMVLKLAEAGADVFRLNFSHGSHEDHKRALDAVRAAEKAVGRPLGALADLQGPKLRLGDFKDKQITLKDGDRFRLDLDETDGDQTRVGMPHPEIFAALKPGEVVLIDDGRARLKVVECGPDYAETVAVGVATLSNHKGVMAERGKVTPGRLTPLWLERVATPTATVSA